MRSGYQALGGREELRSRWLHRTRRSSGKARASAQVKRCIERLQLLLQCIKLTFSVLLKPMNLANSAENNKKKMRPSCVRRRGMLRRASATAMMQPPARMRLRAVRIRIIQSKALGDTAWAGGDGRPPSLGSIAKAGGVAGGGASASAMSELLHRRNDSSSDAFSAAAVFPDPRWPYRKQRDVRKEQEQSRLSPCLE